MKIQIVGIEGNEGMGKKSGKAYSMGNLHTMADLAEAFTADGISRGQMGTTYVCPVPLIRKISGIPLPCFAEVEIRDVMRFGKREQEVIDIKPIETIRKAA